MAVVIDKKPRARKLVNRTNKSKVRSAKPVSGSLKKDMVLDLRRRLQLSQALFARLVPVSVRSLATLESGSPPTEAVARRLVEVRRLMNALSEVMKAESLGSWLQTPNKAFDGLKPLEIIERGEGDRIWSMIYFLRSGVPS